MLIAFNVETMSPLPYCTQPNIDIVPPRSKCSVHITLQAQNQAPRDMQRVDEFIVWSIKVNDGLSSKDITTNMFSKENGVVDAVKLDVVFSAGESTRVNDGVAAEDITTNMERGSSDGDFENRDYGISALVNKLSQAFKYRR